MIAAEGYPPAQVAAALVGIAVKVLTLTSLSGRFGLNTTALAFDFGTAAWLGTLLVLSPVARATVGHVPEILVAVLGRGRSAGNA